MADIRDMAANEGALAKKAEKISSVWPERALMISRLAKREDRLRSLAASLLLYEVLGGGEILHEGTGKPYMTDAPRFNLSHSGDYAVLAVDEAPVGVDIEKWAEADFTALSDAAFHSDERALLARGDTPKTFFDIWTLKESYLKMTGSGLLSDPRAFAVSVGADGDGKADALVPSDPEARLRLYRLDGYSAALCLRHDGFPKGFDAITI
jgi:4'-phosphopantetheinyl transferase